MITVAPSDSASYDINVFTIGSVRRNTAIAPFLLPRSDEPVVVLEEPDLHLHPEVLRLLGMGGSTNTPDPVPVTRTLLDELTCELHPNVLRTICGSPSKKELEAWDEREVHLVGFSFFSELMHALVQRHERLARTREAQTAASLQEAVLSLSMEGHEYLALDDLSHAQAAPRSRCSHRTRSVRAGKSSSDGDGDGGDGHGEQRSVHDLLTAAATRARRIANVASRELRETAINELALRWLNNPDQLASRFSDEYVNTSIRHMEVELMRQAKRVASREVPDTCTCNASGAPSAVEGARTGNDLEARVSAFTQLLYAWKRLCDRALHFAQAVFFDAMGFESQEIAEKLSTAGRAVKAATVRKWIERGHETLRETLAM